MSKFTMKVALQFLDLPSVWQCSLGCPVACSRFYYSIFYFVPTKSDDCDCQFDGQLETHPYRRRL